MNRLISTSVSALCILGSLAAQAQATWSICIGDCRTRELAVGTVTCLNEYDLLGLTPVVVVEKGLAVVQAAGDFEGGRRKIIEKHIRLLNTPPDEIYLILEEMIGHERRQYGLVDTKCQGFSFTGEFNGAWAGGRTGQVGSMFYAIQGNVLAGACVIDDLEQAMLSTFEAGGDMADMLMAGMEAAGQAGGDGRCSCTDGAPPDCGCPVQQFDKSGHIGGMIVARVGDTDDPLCNADGCADGEYLMRLNVAYQLQEDPDPVLQLREQFDHWRSDHVGLVDAVHSTVEFDPPLIPANGTAQTTVTINLRDWQDLPATVAIESLTVEHTADSAGLSTIGALQDEGSGIYTVTLTAGGAAGLDRFQIVAEEQGSGRVVPLMPEPEFEYFELGDLDGNGVVDVADIIAFLAQWGACPEPPAACAGDLDGDHDVDWDDLLILLSHWS